MARINRTPDEEDDEDEAPPSSGAPPATNNGCGKIAVFSLIVLGTVCLLSWYLTQHRPNKACQESVQIKSDRKEFQCPVGARLEEQEQYFVCRCSTPSATPSALPLFSNFVETGDSAGGSSP